MFFCVLSLRLMLLGLFGFWLIVLVCFRCLGLVVFFNFLGWIVRILAFTVVVYV